METVSCECVSNRQDNRTGRGAILQRRVRLGSVTERICLIDFDMNSIRSDHIKKIVCRGNEVVALLDVMSQKRTGEIQGPTKSKMHGGERLNGTGRLAKQYHRAP